MVVTQIHVMDRITDPKEMGDQHHFYPKDGCGIIADVHILNNGIVALDVTPDGEVTLFHMKDGESKVLYKGKP